MIWFWCSLVLLAVVLVAFVVEAAINVLAGNSLSKGESQPKIEVSLTRRAKLILAAAWGVPVIWLVAALPVEMHPLTFLTGGVGCLIITAIWYCIIGRRAMTDPTAYLEGDSTSDAAKRHLLYPGVAGIALLTALFVPMVVIALILR